MTKKVFHVTLMSDDGKEVVTFTEDETPELACCDMLRTFPRHMVLAIEDPAKVAKRHEDK